MSLPIPLPDNPQRWDGWKNYNSSDPYARLCLSFESNPSAEQIEDNCRQLLVWWQKKLPLKNQPSNPIAQILRAGLDEAPRFLAEARSVLLNAESRARIDAALHDQTLQAALAEFNNLLSFALSHNELRAEDEERLCGRGRALGLSQEAMDTAIEAELTRTGGRRVATPVAPPPQPVQVAAPAAAAPAAVSDPAEEFRKLLKMSRLCLDGEEMTDDQRDAMCNMGESLGLTGGQAEDLIDEYLEAASMMPAPVLTGGGRAAVATAPAVSRAISAVAAPVRKPETPAPAVVKAPPREINTSPLARSQERLKYPNFTNTLKMEMILVPSGQFFMGSDAPDAQPSEQPITPTTQSCFYMARFPVTNAQYEVFDKTHVAKRAPWADGNHPVVYVSASEAESFCRWLSSKEGKRYRLPTEAEWEYAARGVEGRRFPWGDVLNSGCYANFADKRTNFLWRDTHIDCGFAETSPVGSFPKGASPFGIEELSGNVFEWCCDCFEPYKGKDRVNPKGPSSGQKRNYRGGSWKSRAGSLRATARAQNLPGYSSNDVGFRVICECE